MAYINDRISGFLGYMAARVIAGQRNRKESIRIENLTATFDPLTAEAVIGDYTDLPEGHYIGYPGRYENGHLIVEDQETGGDDTTGDDTTIG